MKTQYVVDTNGKFIGAFFGGKLPDGATVVATAPENASQIWDGSNWSLYDNSAELLQELWQAASDYESQFITGTAPAMVAVNAAAGKPKAVAVEAWNRNLWTDYHTRKADLQKASMDFSNNGPMPFTLLELMGE